MQKILLFNIVLGLCGVSVLSQTIRNTRLVDHKTYMIRVVENVMQTVEQSEWCSLRLPDINQHIHQDLIKGEIRGHVTYKNGFLVSVRNLNIHPNIQQVWSYNSVANLTTVEVRATVQMHYLQIGYDAVVGLADRSGHYTGTITHPLVPFLFTVRKNLFTDEISAIVDLGTVTRDDRNLMAFMPNDEVGQVLSVLFRTTGGCDIIGGPHLCGIRKWADVFQSILLDVATNKELFPRICYNCPT